VSDELASGVEAFAELYDRQCDGLLVFFARRTWDPEAAMDLTAEPFAQALVARGSFRGQTREELDGWLFAIARHQLAHYFRRGRAERSTIERLGMRVPDMTADDLERIEELAGIDRFRGALAEQLAELSAEQRRALRLRIVKQLLYDVVAQRLGVSEQTVRKRVSHGLQKLGKALGPVRELNEELGERSRSDPGA
jgi:RNA polymerase sigma factor (sigma-70 family)